MKAPKVRLYIRIRHADGKDAYADPAWNRNRTLREGYATVNGKHEHHPEGVYYLRYKRGAKRVWDSIGTRADLALVALRNVEHDLQAQALGRTIKQTSAAEDVHAPAGGSLTVREARDQYLLIVRGARSPKTISCEYILGRFQEAVTGKLIETIDRDDLIRHMASLREEGLSERTVFNHVARINTFLRENNRPNPLKAVDWPRYDEKEVLAYHTDEVTALLKASCEEDRLLWKFFLGTGFREQEVTYCTWANVDFRNKLVKVYSKPEVGFRVKDKEERSVPVPDALVEALAALKRRSSSTFLFPSATGKPEGHYLRRLQRVAFRAGLNCGECVSTNGTQCSDVPVCSEWGLHKFRKTFATFHSEANVPPRTIQAWLSHSKLETTLAYLAVADLRSQKTRNQVNTTFGELLTRGAA